jgi:hypothetical protein
MRHSLYEVGRQAKPAQEIVRHRGSLLGMPVEAQAVVTLSGGGRFADVVK